MWKSKLIMNSTPQFDISEVEQIKLLKRCGFDGFFSTLWMSDGKNSIKALKETADSENMIFQSVHASWNHSADLWSDGEEAQIGIRQLKTTLEQCADNDIPLMVLHAFIGFENHNPTQIGVENYGQVVEYSKHLGVKIAFENTEGMEYLDLLMKSFSSYDNVGFCWDTGHEQCYNWGKDMMNLYGNKILSTHLNDNLGIKDFNGNITWHDDLHLLPFDGICNWYKIAEKLKKYNFTDVLTFELNVNSKPNRLENECYKKMDKEIYITEAFKRACRFASFLHY